MTARNRHWLEYIWPRRMPQIRFSWVHCSCLPLTERGFPRLLFAFKRIRHTFTLWLRDRSFRQGHSDLRTGWDALLISDDVPSNFPLCRKLIIPCICAHNSATKTETSREGFGCAIHQGSDGVMAENVYFRCCDGVCREEDPWGCSPDFYRHLFLKENTISHLK